MTISLVDKVAGTTPAGGGGAVSSVNSRTGNVVLTAADVGATLLTGSNTGDETTTSIGTLISGASEKSVIATADKIALSDSASSGILKWGSTADILQALYLLGIPRTTFQTAVPFVLPPGDGGSNGLTFTGGGGGAFTLSAAPMAGLLAGLSGQWCYGYLPANAGGSGNSAGWYGFIPSSDTAGTFYADQYTGGQPQIVGSPTTFAGSPSGRITTPTSEITAISGINLTPIGINGEVEWKNKTAGDTASGNKFFRLKFGGTTGLAETASTNPILDCLMTLRNRGDQTKQTASRVVTGGASGVGTSASSISGDFVSIDLSGATTALTITMQLTANTGCMVLLSSSITQKFRP